jgi:hypothetical protein
MDDRANMVKQISHAEQYRALLAEAAKLAPPGFVSPPPIAPADAAGYFFPWEHSPYRANGTTNSEPTSK